MLAAALTLIASLGVTAEAADPPAQVGPVVTVTSTRNPATTPSETAYVDTLAKKLQSASRYPTGRDASLERPSGTATVWADVARDGKVRAHGVQESSGSPMLDRMARSLIGRERFPAFAAGDWNADPKHRFLVSYQFDGAAMTAGKQSKGRVATK